MRPWPSPDILLSGISCLQRTSVWLAKARLQCVLTLSCHTVTDRVAHAPARPCGQLRCAPCAWLAAELTGLSNQSSSCPSNHRRSLRRAAGGGTVAGGGGGQTVTVSNGSPAPVLGQEAGGSTVPGVGAGPSTTAEAGAPTGASAAAGTVASPAGLPGFPAAVAGPGSMAGGGVPVGSDDAPGLPPQVAGVFSSAERNKNRPLARSLLICTLSSVSSLGGPSRLCVEVSIGLRPAS